jgi:uncharacterized membrane protein SpoIIM required for sporulation
VEELVPEPQDLARLESLLGRSLRRGAAGASFDELRELARLYRRAAARLARLRQRDDDPEALRYLNALCVRAYAHLAAAAPPPAPSREPFGQRVLAALARTGRAQVLAWVLLAVGVYVGAALCASDPRAAHALVPETFGYGTERVDQLAGSAEARAELLAREATPFAGNVFFGSALFVNNTRVGLLSFATGVFAGVPTILLAVYNGLIVGAIGTLLLQPPYHVEFLAWILPHGIPELTAVTLCVAGGLMLGGAVAAPGRRRRRVALREAADSAMLLFAAAVPLFLLAAAIESFVRESTLGTAARFAVAAAMLALLAVLAGATRAAGRRRPPDASWLAELAPLKDPPRSAGPGNG